MAFPTPLGRASSSTGSGTSHTVTLPSGIQAGEFLLIAVAVDGNTTPSITGWQSISNNNGNAVTLALFGRIADGTEGTSVTMTTPSSEATAHRSWRFPEGTSTDGPANSTGTNTNPNPPSLTPVDGAQDYVWLAISAADRRNHTGFPANYNNTIAVNGGSGGQAVGLGAAERELNTSSEDPGTFTIASSDQWVAYTYSIRFEPRRARVSAFELETPDAPRAARVSAFELETPDAPRRARVSAYELETPDAPRRARISAYELETPDAARRARVSAYELEIGDAPRAVRVSAFELEVGDPIRRARISAFELETPDAPGGVAAALYSGSNSIHTGVSVSL